MACVRMDSNLTSQRQRFTQSPNTRNYNGGAAIFVALAFLFLTTSLTSANSLVFACQEIADSSTDADNSSDDEKKKKKKKAWLRLQGEGPLKKILTVRVEHEGKVYYGRPLGQDSKKLALLRWDGRISVLPRRDKLEIFSKGFAPYTHDELAKRLQKQYGPRYLTQQSKNFLVVYPRTQRKNWAEKYEAVFGQFKAYMARRGIDIADPSFPLVVVVLGSRNEFTRSLDGEIIFKKNVYGYYSRITNRVTTYVSSDPRLAKQVESVANLTLVHESIHQSAFNSGVHNRLCAVPRWMSEGFAMLFESSGFRNDDPDSSVAQRVNKRRLATLKKMMATDRTRGKLESLVRNDQMFISEPDLAYSLAWGLSFYLAEKEKEKYLRFAIQDGNQKEFANYTPDERVTFFVETFKTDFDTLEKKLKAFVMKL